MKSKSDFAGDVAIGEVDIYFSVSVDIEPFAYCPWEEVAFGESFFIDFEEAVLEEKFKGIFQYINRLFIFILPQKYGMINGEQDLVKEGLRKAKETYNPVVFVKRTKFGLNSI